MRELFYDLTGEDVIASQSFIAPYRGVLADIRAQVGFQILVESGDPALVVIWCGLVVGVGVADEKVFFEGHEPTQLRSRGRRETFSTLTLGRKQGYFVHTQGPIDSVLS